MTNIVRLDPFDEIRNLQKQIFGDDWFSNFPLKMQLPTTDMYTEDDKQLTIEAHLPNFDQNDVDISVDNGSLVIQAERHEKDEDKKRKYVVRESSSSFYRRIRLPKHVDESKIEAQIDEGVLKVTIPFKELPQPKKIAIKARNK